MDQRPTCDLLSDLPLSIIHSILTFVPIRDAVKTSILSRQWKYIWATLPYLVFDDQCESVKTSMNNFITQALFLHKGPIHKFELHVPVVEECHFITQWLIFLSRNGIKMLIVDADGDVGPDMFQIRSSVYSCENLTHLELWNCEIPPPPLTFNGFLCLRCLDLCSLEVSPNTIESLIANSSLLEELRLYNIFDHNSERLKLKIHAPNLKIFYVDGDYKEIYLYAPLLAKMSATLFVEDFTPEPLQQTSSGCNYTKFLGSLTNLEELTGLFYLVEYLSIGVELSHCSLVFHHLRVIDLSNVTSGDVKQMWVVVRLITGAPNLHTLKIRCVSLSEHTSEVASTSFWDSEFAPDLRFERLKLIEIRNVDGELNGMKLAELLLASSPVLETLIFSTYSLHTEDHKSQKLETELLGYHRASTNAQILFS